MDEQIRRTLENALEVLLIYCLEPEIPQVEAARAWLDAQPAATWQPVTTYGVAVAEPGTVVDVQEDGARIGIITLACAASARLPDDLRLCRKVQPAPLAGGLTP